MASDADARYGRVTIVVAVLALIVAAIAAERARDAARPYTITLPLGFQHRFDPYDLFLPGRFWIGAWCPPPARATTAEAWLRFSDAGIDAGIYPLEDEYRREDNLARLALLDSLNQARRRQPPIFAFVRDDSLHPDETFRPGWEGRLERAHAAYAPFRSCAGIFVGDEPSFVSLPVYAPIARALALPERGAPRTLFPFVNFAGLPAHPTLADRPRWRERLARSVREAGLPFFTVDCYAAPSPSGEWPNAFLALSDAARVASELGIQFGWLIQVTGHGPFPPATPAQARLRAFQAMAHGATAIVWFTYWTPNPNEKPWLWHDGLVEYASGQPTRQYAMVQAVNAEARACSRLWGAGTGTGVAHLGGGLPAGADALAAARADVVPGLREVRGGPVTVAWRAARGELRRLLVVNRDVVSTSTFELTFDPRVVRNVEGTTFDGTGDAMEPFGERSLRIRLPAGGAAALALELTEEGMHER